MRPRRSSRGSSHEREQRLDELPDKPGIDGDPLTDPAARDGAVRDYRTWLQTVANRKPATINTILAALADLGCR